MNTVVFALCGVVAAMSSVASAGELLLAERGKPARYAIVLPADASPSQKTAADDLRDHFEKMAGVRLPVCSGTTPERAIFLGTAPIDGFREVDPALGNDGFRIASRPPHLVIAGSKVHGTLFGVYDFLERHCGCEWFSSKTTVVPSKDAIAVPAGLDETRVPAFKVRDMSWYANYHDQRLNARLKLNGMRIQYTEEFGGRDQMMDTSTYGATFEVLLPSKKYFDAHPEWFAEVNGRRTKHNTQPCLSNPEVVEMMKSNLLARIAKNYPRAKYYGFAQNDWWSYCTCAKCREIDEREGAQSGSMIEFINKMAEAVEKDYPDVTVWTFAYMYTLKPPKSIRARKNVMIQLCTDACDFYKPIETSAWQGCVNFRNNLDGWKRTASKFYIWDYAANFNYVLAPFPCLPAAQANMKYFLANGIDILYEEGQHNSSHAADAELKNWVLAHLMWDPYQPLEPLLDRFFKGYYGAAAPMAREYYDRLLALPRDERKLPMTMWGKLIDPPFPPEFFDEASALWERAAAAVADDPVRSENVEWARNAVDYMRVMCTTYAAPLQVTRHPEYTGSESFRSLKKAAPRILADFEREPVAGKFYHFDEYKERLKQLVELDSGRIVASDRVEVEERYFTFGGKPKAKLVADKPAGNGRAFKLTPDLKPRGIHTAHFALSNLRFDTGGTYRLRVRARVEATGKPGEAFVAGTLDRTKGDRRQIPATGFQAADFGADYKWVDVGTWKPEIAESVWIALGNYDDKALAANPAVKAVYVDKIEISRVNSAEHGRR